MQAEDLLRQSQEFQRQLTDYREAYFFDNVVFSYQWYLLWAVLIGSYVFLWYVADRSRLTSILLVGSIVFGISMTADGIGGELLLWDYPHMSLPWGARLLQADLIIPVGYMLIYQWFRGWRVFFLASLALSALYAFVFEPFAVSTNVYDMYHWRYIYSFPIFTAIGLLSKFAADAAENARENPISAA